MPGSLQVKCNIYQTTVPLVDPAANDTELSLRQPLVSLVRPLPPFHPRGLSPAVHGHMHHKLTLHHDPSVSGLLSESNESGEVPTAAVPITITKRESPLVIPEVIPELPLAPGIQICPGRIRHF
ncbi:hypothetical protein JZ751_025104 [Albula glossodonta]|uniref:Uncharacterized protein n=1 Tax=Albula glossodonta TaxID=121402 RepID=A0A8T2PCY3_9TELE|nr:hypothetical protein JZ751_025104 [Albula glossodonta]